jgi:hypothetical protein
MKSCEADNCVNPVFGGGMCKWHQNKRTDRKPSKPIPKYSERQKTHETGFGFDSQQEMFYHLWENAKDINADVICPFTGEKLNRYRNTNMFWNCFLHILPKGQYTYFKLNPANVIVASPEFHRIIDQGTHQERLSHPTWRFDLWDSEVIAMKAEYALFKRNNLLP